MRVIPRHSGIGSPHVSPHEPTHSFWMLGIAWTGVEVNSSVQVQSLPRLMRPTPPISHSYCSATSMPEVSSAPVFAWRILTV